jgi:hypothetical protein
MPVACAEERRAREKRVKMGIPARGLSVDFFIIHPLRSSERWIIEKLSLLNKPPNPDKG